MKSLIFIGFRFHFPEVLLFLLSVFAIVTILDGSHAYANIGSHQHECVHSQVAIPLNELPYVNVGYKSLLSSVNASPLKGIAASARSNIRFYANFLFDGACSFVGETVDTYVGGSIVCGENDILTPRKVRTLHALVQSAFDFLEKALLVDSLTSVSAPENVCGFLKNPLVNALQKDFILFVTANPREIRGNAIAWARACARDPHTERPVVGHINFIPSSVKNYVREIDKRVAMHELTHALGFTDLANTAKEHIGPLGVPEPGSRKIYRPELEKYVTIITTPKVVEAARKHFGCPTLDGVEIEDTGGIGTAGSHWKKRILFEEALVGVITSPNIYYSSITLGFLESLGYYSVNYDVAEDNFQWGKNKTCRFLYNKCNDQDKGVDEFCFQPSHSPSSPCTNDRLGIGQCDIVRHSNDLPPNSQYFRDSRTGGSLPEMDYCPFIMGYSNIDCINKEVYDSSNIFGSEFSIYSRCFESNMITGAFPNVGTGARCFPITCTESGQILIRVQGQTALCPVDGKAGYADTSHLVGIHGKIKCPSAIELCGDVKGNGVSENLPISLLTDNTESYSPLTVHSPINFTREYKESCEERVKCAASLTPFFPACRSMAKKIIDCFGRDCENTMQKWLYENNFTQKCKDPSALAYSCLDSWIGVNELCAVASAAYPLKVQFSLITILLVTMMVAFVN
ncbi:Peptidase M8 [Trypanosoma melophagium]|uniref:Peptidase M8 n=1 Tax=Trypanosoma melophagium TaxID=715481 RepID=UPI003519D8A8|nr:Peptidase M8 [Trypanosoma melophagium]